MQNFQFYKAKEVYREKYFQLPKIFFTNDKYKALSNDAKIAYTLLKDRFEYSIQNNWVDEDGNIYFIFTVQELMKMLNCREGKVNKIKKELTETGLLYQKRAGFKIQNGRQVNQPNYMYLGKPEITSKDIFTISEEESNGIAKNTNPSEFSNSGTSNGIAKNANPSEPSGSDTSNGIAKNANNLFYSSIPLDTLDTLDTKKEALQQQLLLDQFAETQDNTFLSQQSLNFISVFSDTIQEAYEQVGTIVRAKTKVEKDYDIVLIGEDYQEEIDKCLRRVMHKIKTDSTVKSPKGLFYKSFYNLFVECAIEKKRRLNKQSNVNSPEITMHDWV